MARITRIILWAWVIIAGILIGGALYEKLVLLPLWAGSPPDSVKAWPYGAVQVAFFGWATPIYGVLSLLLFILGSRIRNESRKWLAVAGASGLVIAIWTFLFFVPILQATQANRGAGLSGDEITTMVNQFVNWNYLRMAILILGWIAGLKAFSLRSSD